MIEDQKTDWELVKENAAPLQRGRNIATLGKTLAQSSKLSNKIKEEDTSIKKFELLIEPSEKYAKEYMTMLYDRMEKSVDQETVNQLLQKHNLLDGDPLSVWIRYLKYHEETYPTDTHSQFLIMERCTRAFFHLPRYADDTRYIRVCVLYADRTSNPNETFISFHQNKIGINTAIFWLAWAWLAEKKEDFAFAEKIFRKAISKKAEPSNIIDLRYKQFQRRMSRHFLNSAHNFEMRHVDEGLSDSVGRRILGAICEEGIKFNHRSAYDMSDNHIPGQNRQTGLLSSVTVNNKTQKPQMLSVYVDQNDEHNPGYSNLDASRITSGVGTITSERDKCKENNLTAERWNERGGLKSMNSVNFEDISGTTNNDINDQVMAQRWTTSVSDARSIGGSFSVFVDDEFSTSTKEDRQEQSAKPSELGKGIRIDLDKRPAYHSVATCLGSDHVTRTRKIETVVNTHEERCFEENRAIMRKITKNSSSQTNFNDLKKGSDLVNANDYSSMDLDDETCDVKEANLCQFSKLNISRDFPECVSQSFQTQSTTYSSVIDSDAVGIAGDREETINTRLAARELSMMFSSPGMCEKSVCDKSIVSSTRIYNPTAISSHDVVRSKRLKSSSNHMIDRDGVISINISRDNINKNHLRFEIFDDDSHVGLKQTDKTDRDDNSRSLNTMRGNFMNKPETMDVFGDISLIASNDDTHEYDTRSSQVVITYDDLHSSNCLQALSRVQSDRSCLICKSKNIPTALVQPMRNGPLIEMGERSCTFRRELGRGCNGTVVLCSFSETSATNNQDAALKIQRPTSCLAWEYNILKMINNRLSVSVQRKDISHMPPFPRPLAFSLFSDGGVLSMTAGSGINLLDVTNAHKGTVPELLAIYYTSRMIAHLETLHLQCDILHCDIKPDNWVLTVASPCFTDKACAPIFGGDIMLVDFGRSIDMTSIKESSSASNVLFSGKIVSEDMECVAMREGRPWSADVDTFGLCASAHVLLFGCHMDIVYDSQSCRWQTKKKLRRYWRQDLWESMFGSLLNLTPGDSHSIRLGVLRKEFETYLRDFKVMNDVVTLLKGQHAYFHKVQS